jgi:hypothetical protein
MNSKNSELCVTENIVTHLRNFSLGPHVQIDSESIQQPIQPRPAILTRSKIRIRQLISIWSRDHEFMESHLLSTFITMGELLITGTNFPSQYMYFRTIFKRQDFRLLPRCSCFVDRTFSDSLLPGFQDSLLDPPSRVNGTA